MTMITPSYLGETIEYSSLHACRSTLEDPTSCAVRPQARCPYRDRERAVSNCSWPPPFPAPCRDKDRAAVSNCRAGSVSSRPALFSGIRWISCRRGLHADVTSVTPADFVCVPPTFPSVSPGMWVREAYKVVGRQRMHSASATGLGWDCSSGWRRLGIGGGAAVRKLGSSHDSHCVFR